MYGKTADEHRCCSCATGTGAAMPSPPRRSMLTQIVSPEFRPDLALKVIASLENHIAELEQTLCDIPAAQREILRIGGRTAKAATGEIL
jgi:hypothetical protein